jgi:hypothetical protein
LQVDVSLEVVGLQFDLRENALNLRFLSLYLDWQKAKKPELFALSGRECRGFIGIGIVQQRCTAQSRKSASRRMIR